MDIPLIICALSGLFYGMVWVLNKDLMWGRPLHTYDDYADYCAQAPKGLWLTPLIVAFCWPHNYHKVSFSPMPDFVWQRIVYTTIAVIFGLVLARHLKPYFNID